MMRLATRIILCLWFCICSSANVFRQPPGAGPTGNFRSNPIYVIGEILDIQWDSDDDSAAVTLYMIQASEESEPAQATIFCELPSLLLTIEYNEHFVDNERPLA